MDSNPSLDLGDIDKPLYDWLNVPVTASPDDIKKAYRQMARSCHPDKHPDNVNAKEIFQMVSRAYQVLTDPASREQHDHHFCCLDQLSFEEYLQRYFYMLFSPQGLSLRVSKPQQPLEPPPMSEEDRQRLCTVFAAAG
mmetsp:Transcript_14827/g.44790  ORF Transcript_14827/g.44790 Transcript_14827/m.44790 type:complete len:138 (+) Transcript_14827:295-708(+)